MNNKALTKRAAHLPTLWMSVGVVFMGTAAAVIRGNMEVLPAILALLYAIFTQLAANFLHAYFEMGRYYDNIPRPRFNDGGRKGHPYAIYLLKQFASGCFLLSFMAGLGLVSIGDSWFYILILGLVIYVIIALLNVGRHPLFSTIWSYVATFLLFGPIGVLGTALPQTQHESIGNMWSYYDFAPSLFLGPSLGMLALTVHCLFSYTAYRADADEHKDGMASRLSPNALPIMVFFNGVIMYCIVLWMMMSLHVYSWLIGMTPAFIGLMLNSYIAIMMKRSTVMGLSHLSRIAIANYALTGILSFFFFMMIAPPDDSHLQLF